VTNNISEFKMARQEMLDIKMYIYVRLDKYLWI